MLRAWLAVRGKIQGAVASLMVPPLITLTLTLTLTLALRMLKARLQGLWYRTCGERNPRWIGTVMRRMK